MHRKDGQQHYSAQLRTALRRTQSLLYCTAVVYRMHDSLEKKVKRMTSRTGRNWTRPTIAARCCCSGPAACCCACACGCTRTHAGANAAPGLAEGGAAGHHAPPLRACMRCCCCWLSMEASPLILDHDYYARLRRMFHVHSGAAEPTTRSTHMAGLVSGLPYNALTARTHPPTHLCVVLAPRHAARPEPPVRGESAAAAAASIGGRDATRARATARGTARMGA